jgi:hypothetical protein
MMVYTLTARTKRDIALIVDSIVVSWCHQMSPKVGNGVRVPSQHVDAEKLRCGTTFSGAKKVVWISKPDVGILEHVCVTYGMYDRSWLMYILTFIVTLS